MGKKYTVAVQVDSNTGEMKFKHSPDLQAEEVQHILGEATVRWTSLYIIGDNEPSKIQAPAEAYDIEPNSDGGFSINKKVRTNNGGKRS